MAATAEITAPATTTAVPLYITMHELDNVAIVVNDGGLPAGTTFPSGLKLVDKVPHGHWRTLTFLAALRHDRIDAPGPGLRGEHHAVGERRQGDVLDVVGRHEVAPGDDRPRPRQLDDGQRPTRAGSAG